ncbi:hypothetical protein PsorP6_014434 [Peronosclerospora sorghi]|uniref:Uncharacterized protein n=1 Tax=Peronosclerospora sorghi TaxID=230839 RepID=A0ACC0VI75_9STRA|nr:hypothetical protein PsorP6_014434 [Peronosclerospora sorghi]
MHQLGLYCEELLCGYINVLQTRLEKLEELLSNSNRACIVSTTTQKRLESDMKELRDERNTWRLLFELRKVYLGNKELADGENHLMNFSAGMKELRFETLEDDAVRLLGRFNETFKIQKAVKAWLENMAMEKTINIGDRGKATGSRTLKVMRKQVLPGKKVHMDPDVVLREGDDHILSDDMDDEAELMKAV